MNPTDPDHSLLLSYQISDVEVFDYQLADLRTEFIRPSFSYFFDSICEDFFLVHNFLRETSNVCKLGGAFLAHK